MIEINLTEPMIKDLLKSMNEANNTIYSEFNNGNEHLEQWINFFDQVLEGKKPLIIIIKQ